MKITGLSLVLRLWLICGVGLWCLGTLTRAAEQPAAPPQPAGEATKPAAPPAQPPARAERRHDLSELSVEDLMNIEVTTPGKSGQKLFDVPAAIYVLTSEDIHRSTATTIPDLLRLVPGMDVAQIDSNKWAVSARGFNGQFANKLLVLVDGRSVYSPFFGGVYWAEQDMIFDDIDRIEVICGPGGSLWGANAENGIINIISKDARDTQGGLFSVGAGNIEYLSASARFGARAGDDVYYRVWAKGVRREDEILLSGGSAGDDWDNERGGFRLDWYASRQDMLTFQGDLFRLNAGNGEMSLPSPNAPFSEENHTGTDSSGGNILGRWRHNFSDTSDLAVQMYYDHSDRREVILRTSFDTFDFDFQHRFALGDRQEFTWGAGYRFISGEMTSSDLFVLSFDPEKRSQNVYSAFLQDDLVLAPELLHFIPGAKFEHNDSTGYEYQPSARLLFTPSRDHTIWAAVSRAVRTPYRVEEDFSFTSAVIPPSPLRTDVITEGSRDYKSETVTAYELGYRVHPADRLSLSVATFYNQYHHLGTVEPGAPVVDMTSPYAPRVILPMNMDNLSSGRSYGVEVAADWQPTKWWRLTGAYSFFDLDISSDVNSHEPNPGEADGQSPENQASLRSMLDLPWNLTFDTDVRYVESLPQMHIPKYIEGDARLAWSPRKTLEVSVGGRNLFDPHHPEFFQESIFTAQQVEVRRSFFAQITYKF